MVAKHSNTSNLISHLQVNHSKIHSEFQDAIKKSSTNESGSMVTQITLQALMEKSQKYNRKGKKWNELTNADTYIGKEAQNCL